MKKQDWHLLILHFLGLDHIGHVEGPRSALVGPKLQEMDSVIESVHSRGAQSPLLLLTGDHGMHDGGGHGGASASERNVGLVLLGTRCASGGPSGSWAQVDLASTLAVLLGVEIPEGSAGALVPALLAPLGQRGSLTALFSNAKRLLRAAPGAKQGLSQFYGLF
jgi:ethanolamine phosphate transferase 2 subunit G